MKIPHKAKVCAQCLSTLAHSVIIYDFSMNKNKLKIRVNTQPIWT